MESKQQCIVCNGDDGMVHPDGLSAEICMKCAGTGVQMNTRRTTPKEDVALQESLEKSLKKVPTRKRK